MIYYDDESKSLTLVEDVNGEKLETKTYQYPFFVKGIYTKKAIELGAELEVNEYGVTLDLFDRLTNYVSELYGKQFTAEELTDGIDSREIVQVFIKVLFGVLGGDTSKNE